MIESGKALRVLDCEATAHEYLHKDFHGALCYGIKYLDEHFGREATAAYLREVGRSCYASLIQLIKNEGLNVLDRHWNEVFTREGGKFTIERRGGTLVLTVQECPAIAHLKKINQFFTPRYCETTVVVNDTICSQAGYACSTEYEPGAGRCIQQFWKLEE